MKKLMSLALALAMCGCLAACGGGVDKQPAIDAHNAAGAAINELGDLINANPEALAGYVDQMNELVDDMNTVGEKLGSDEKMDQATLDEWIELCNKTEQQAKDAKAEIEAALAAASEPEQQPDASAGGEASGLDYFVGTWSLCGGVSNDTEWTEDDLNATLEMYGGKLDAVIGADGSAQLVQGGGALTGTCEPVDAGDGALGLYMSLENGTLEYAGDLLSTEDGDVLLSLTPDAVTYMYFIQTA